MKIRTNAKRLNPAAVRINSGSMLIELMVAIIVAGMLAISLCQSLSLTKGASFGAHGRVICSAVAQDIAERLRDTPYSSLPTTGTFPIQVYSDTSISPLTYPSIQQPPLMMDINAANYVWTQKSIAGRFPISSSVTFAAGPSVGSTSVTISVNASNVQSSYTSSILLTQYGVQGQ